MSSKQAKAKVIELLGPGPVGAKATTDVIAYIRQEFEAYVDYVSEMAWLAHDGLKSEGVQYAAYQYLLSLMLPKETEPLLAAAREAAVQAMAAAGCGEEVINEIKQGRADHWPIVASALFALKKEHK